MICLKPGHPSNYALFDALFAVAERNAARKNREMQELDDAFRRDVATDETLEDPAKGDD